jgi:two-component system NarL family response regulator
MVAQMANMRVMLVDDHAVYLEGLRNLLMVRGFDVVASARNGWDAIAQLQQRRPDLVLMDARMPECDGIRALQLIKAQAPDIPVILMVLPGDWEMCAEAIRAGAAGCLSKATTPSLLLSALLDLVGSPWPVRPPESEGGDRPAACLHRSAV